MVLRHAMGLPKYQSVRTTSLNASESSLAEDGNVSVQRWRPASFSRVALISTIITIASFLAGTIGLQIRNQTAGGIVFASTENDFTDAQNFLYQYLPTILIVIFGIWISVLDLDIKRLDPWCRLSKGSGYSSSALFCRYDAGCVLTSMYKALRAR